MSERFSLAIDEREVAHLTITHARKANILGSDTISAIVSAMDTLAQNPDLRALVLTGEGNRAFVGGADVREMARLDPETAREFITRLASICEAARQFPVPVIARMNGATIGGGLELAMACDFRICVAGATLAMPEVRLGIPSVIHAAIMPRLIGLPRTRRLIYTAEVIDAELAFEWGLVDAVVAPQELDTEVDRWLDSLLANPPEVMRNQKRLLRKWEQLPLSEAVAVSVSHFAEAYVSGEPQRAMQAFLESGDKR